MGKVPNFWHVRINNNKIYKNRTEKNQTQLHVLTAVQDFLSNLIFSFKTLKCKYCYEVKYCLEITYQKLSLICMRFACLCVVGILSVCSCRLVCVRLASCLCAVGVSIMTGISDWSTYKNIPQTHTT